MRQSPAILSLAILPSLAVPAGAISITFDYSHDTTGFFTDPARKAILNLAAGAFTPFTDSLSAITPSGNNHWTAAFFEPTNTANTGTAADITLPANTLTVFVGASDLPGATLGLGGPGGYSYPGGITTSFANAVYNRGQTGDTHDSATATDFARWGGSISFDSLTNWFFGSSTSGMTGSQADFLSVATHELAHVLGFGTSDSFTHDTAGANFVGPNAESKHAGAPIPLNSDVSHWANGVTSILPGTANSQETSMDPSITLGTRKLFTALDYAAMKDIGWQVPAASLVTYIPGDINHDGAVDLTDLNNVLNNFGSSAPAGDSNGDHQVDLTDLNNVLNHFGVSGAPTGLTTVPEPATLALLALPAVAFLRRRRTR